MVTVLSNGDEDIGPCFILLYKTGVETSTLNISIGVYNTSQKVIKGDSQEKSVGSNLAVSPCDQAARLIAPVPFQPVESWDP